MNALFEAAKEVCDFMDARQWKYCIIGGLAVLRWGKPRTTLDVEMSLFTGFGNEENYADTLLSSFSKRMPDAHEHALKYRVLPVQASNNKALDIAFAGFPFENDIIKRATPFRFSDTLLVPTCSAEDLFVMKMFAARDKDLADAITIATRQQLDSDHVLRLLEPLCELKESPELVNRALQILEETQ